MANNHTFNLLVPYLNKKDNLKNLPIPKSITEKTRLNILEPSHFPTDYSAFDCPGDRAIDPEEVHIDSR